MEKNNVVSWEEKDLRAEILAIIRESGSEEEIRSLPDRYHANDIASVLEELTEEEARSLLRTLGTPVMSDIVSYMEDSADYLLRIDTEEAADIIEQMDADDARDALEDLDEKTRDELWEHIEDEEIKEELTLLNSYEDEEFGSRMSTNFILIPRGYSVKQAMRALIAEAADHENISMLFVTEADGSFYGAIELKDLIAARSEVPLDSLIYTAFPYVCDKDVISDHIDRLRGYSEDLIPVLSAENRSLLGVITSRELLELWDEEQGDDYAKLAALGGEEERDEPLLRSMKKRIPWLLILLVLGLGVSAAVGFFEGVVSELPMLVAFQSLILGMAGNVGTQSLAVTVRGLGNDRAGKEKGSLLTILRETRIALLNGFALGLISFLIVTFYLGLFGSYAMGFTLSVAGCVGGAMCFAMTVSGFTGAAIPLCLSRLGTDPAVASGPLITTVNDLVAVISYYGLAWGLLLQFK